ncbi:MAG: 4Fe-4S binding protein, partial [Anaerolineae bacterium]|nr:4Fe-4S binding protein [Anaerolineae bacterium]
VLYKDIRTYGFIEKYYRQAREMGVIFMRYDDRQKPEVEVDPHTRRVTMQVYDPVLKRGFQMRPDLLVLSMPVVPRMDAKRLANIFKVPLDGSGFFLEAHVKLRPVDFSTNGVFMAGMAHYPKLSDESLVQAQAAASRALRVITQPAIKAGGRVAVVEPHMCTGCLTCVRICPFHVPQIDARLAGAGGIMGAAVIEAAVCQGCGICAAECPGHAIQLMHYTDVQMNAKIDALFRSDPEFIPLEDIVIDPQDL